MRLVLMHRILNLASAGLGLAGFHQGESSMGMRLCVFQQLWLSASIRQVGSACLLFWLIWISLKEGLDHFLWCEMWTFGMNSREEGWKKRIQQLFIKGAIQSLSGSEAELKAVARAHCVGSPNGLSKHKLSVIRSTLCLMPGVGVFLATCTLFPYMKAIDKVKP